jgi:hypothetical protein
VTWVHLYWAEAKAAQAMGVETNSTRRVAFCLERLDRAQRRYLAALGAWQPPRASGWPRRHNPASPVAE